MRTEAVHREVQDSTVLARTVDHLREAGVALPTFAQLTDPELAPFGVREALAAVGPDVLDPPLLRALAQLRRPCRRRRRPRAPRPAARNSPGVDARIVVALKTGSR